MPRREVVPLTAEDVLRVPWRNGRGATEELALWPPGASLAADDFDWRVARAAVEEPGPFSAFPGLERVLVVIEGEALVLEHGAAAPRTHLRRLEPYRFAGEWPTAAALPRGPVRDVSVLARRGRAEARVDALRLGARRLREEAGASHVLLLLLRGACVARVTDEEETFAPAPGLGLWMREARPGDELELEGHDPATEVLLVRIGPPG